MFQHEQCTGLGKEGHGKLQGIQCPIFHVFPTSVLAWMAWHSFSHVSLICFVLFWITSILLWLSFCSLDANSFKETILECPRGFTSFTKSLNFFSSTCGINGDRLRYKNFCLPLWEGQKESLSLYCITQKLCIAAYKCKSLDKPRWYEVRRRHPLSWSFNILYHREKSPTSWQTDAAQIKS